MVHEITCFDSPIPLTLVDDLQVMDNRNVIGLRISLPKKYCRVVLTVIVMICLLLESFTLYQMHVTGSPNALTTEVIS